ncbi:MAG: hypothetical protein HYS45_00170 [Parcubacteria group bacterium]|nr:hypothetical protein [Parcubacteria group bacterium]
MLTARVSPAEIAEHQKNGWFAYSVDAVNSDIWEGGGDPIAAGGHIGERQVAWLKRYRVTDIPVVFIPKELAGRHKELCAKVLGVRDHANEERKAGHQQSGARAQDRVALLVRRCIALVQNLRRIPVGVQDVDKDPIVVQLITECKEALLELEQVMLLVAHDLFNGDGRRLGELRGLPEIDDRSAHCIFRYGMEAVLYVHHLKLLLGWRITAEEAVNVFLAAIFMNIGLLAAGDITEQNHRNHSAHIYRIIRDQKPELPDAVVDLILDHGHVWVSKLPYLYRLVIDDGTGEIGSQRHQYSPTKLPIPEPQLLQPFRNEDDPGPRTYLALLDTRYMANALILTVAERVVDRSMRGEREASVLEELAGRITEGGWRLTERTNEHQCVFALVLAAAANAHRVRPRGSVMKFGSSKVPDGNPIAVSLGHPDEPAAPYCLVVTNDAIKGMLPRPRGIQALVAHKPGSLKRTQQLVLGLGREAACSTIWHTAGNTAIGFVDTNTYTAHCAEVEARMPHILEALSKG